eukprot:gene28632-35523_t
MFQNEDDFGRSRLQANKPLRVALLSSDFDMLSTAAEVDASYLVNTGLEKAQPLTVNGTENGAVLNAKVVSSPQDEQNDEHLSENVYEIASVKREFTV